MYLLIYWLTDWRSDWSTDWLTDWLTYQLTNWFLWFFLVLDFTSLSNCSTRWKVFNSPSICHSHSFGTHNDDHLLLFIIFILLPVKNKDFIIMLLSLFRVYMQCPWILWIQQWHNLMLPLRYVHVCTGLLECKLTFSTQNSILYFWNFWESSFGAWVSCLDFSKIEFWRTFQTSRFWWSAVRKQLISF